MTINISLRKGSRTVVTESLLLAVVKAREPGEEMNVTVYPGGTVEVVATE